MTNKDKELQILKAYYEKRYSNISIDEDSFDLADGRHEGAFYLDNLERDGKLSFDGEVIIKGGLSHEKYNNSVAMVRWDDAHITTSGEQYLKENNLI